MIIEPPTEESTTGEAFVETTTVEGVTTLEIAPKDMVDNKVDSPVVHTIKVSSTDPAAAEDTHPTKTALAYNKLY